MMRTPSIVDAVVEPHAHVAHRQSRRDADAVVRLLARHHRLVPDGLELLEGELVLFDLELLHAQHVGLVGLEPRNHTLGARADRVDVPGGELHRRGEYQLRKKRESRRRSNKPGPVPLARQWSFI
jgi:hypothetical protein